MWKTRIAALAGIGLLGIGIAAPAANAAPNKPKPVASAAVVTAMPPASIRIDKQSPLPAVTAQGVTKTSPITINWGDGDTGTARARCNPQLATKQPAKCAVTREHYYAIPGTFTVTVTSEGKTLASQSITVNAAPTAWSPPAGFTPAGWSVLNGGATYLPCSTINWYWDRTGEPGDRTLVHDDVQPALDMLSRETGLKFMETADPAAAQLKFDWKADPTYPNAAGVGGGSFNRNFGSVSLNPTNWWTENKWRGFGVVNQPDGWYANGNGWLIIHEVMHALGLGHVNDETQVMNPIATATAFGPGDLDGLHTMYLSQPCPTL